MLEFMKDIAEYFVTGETWDIFLEKQINHIARYAYTKTFYEWQ